MHDRFPLGPLPQELQDQLLNITANSRDENVEKVDVEISFSGERIGYVYSGDRDDVERAFEQAREAQAKWEKVPFAQRQEIFRDFHDRVLDNRELLMDIVQMETGKNRASALDEVMDVAINARYYANNVGKFLGEKKHPGALPVVTRSVQQQVPKGVVGQISPWNYPLALGVSDAIPALLAGNGVVAKPDSNTPFSCLLAVLFLYESGLPRGLMQVVTGSGVVVGGAISELCDYLMFTGSTATGKILGRTVGERLVGFSAEMGGKNPLIVAADADLNVVMREITSACFSNSGQLCVSIERIYVEDEIYDEFMERFVQKVNQMKLGSGFSWKFDMGSLINQAQLDRVIEFVEDAQKHGAKVVAGGKHRPDLGPYFYEPTVLSDVPEDAQVLTDEVFGPVVYVQRVSNLDEAVSLANATPYGLNASVFAASSTGREIAKRIEAGGVGINDGYAASWATVSIPLGGMKQSGQARRHGPDGMLKYTETRNVAEQRGISMRGPEGLSRKAYAQVMVTALRLGKKLRFLP